MVVSGTNIKGIVIQKASNGRPVTGRAVGSIVRAAQGKGYWGIVEWARSW